MSWVDLSVKVRPFGILLLALLDVMAGLFELFLGLGSMAVFGFATTQEQPSSILGVFGAMGSILLILAFAQFLLAWGLVGGRGWARMLGIISAVLGILMGVTSLPTGIIWILIGGGIIYYLTRPEVIDFFKKTTPLPSTTLPPSS